MNYVIDINYNFKKKVGDNSDISDEKLLAIADNFLEYKCISTKHKVLQHECIN